MTPDPTDLSEQGQANAVVLTALAEACGALPDQAISITYQVLEEFRVVPMNAVTAIDVIARVRELATPTTTVHIHGAAAASDGQAIVDALRKWKPEEHQ